MSDADRNTVVSHDDRKLRSVERLGKQGLLIVLSPELFGSSCVITKASIVVGRALDCDFVLNDPLLSRRHCRITVDQRGDFYLEDLNSTNATYLNSRKLQEKTPLHYGDRIILGNTIVRFLIEEEIARG